MTDDIHQLHLYIGHVFSIFSEWQFDSSTKVSFILSRQVRELQLQKLLNGLYDNTWIRLTTEILVLKN